MVSSSSEDITRAMRGQLKPLCRNYLGRNGGNVIVYVLISFHSRDVFCTLSGLFVPPGFVGFVLVWLFIIWPFIRFQGVKLRPRPHLPDIFQSATFSFRIRLPSTRIRRIRQRIRKKIHPLSRVEKNKSATNPITCGRVNADIFKSDDVKSVSSLSSNNKPI